MDLASASSSVPKKRSKVEGQKSKVCFENDHNCGDALPGVRATLLQNIWDGLSALDCLRLSIPGASPQADIDRAFGPQEIALLTAQCEEQRERQRHLR